jgi:hypothetical protein
MVLDRPLGPGAHGRRRRYPRGPRRSTTPEQEAEAFAIVKREGVHRAMRLTGLGDTVLYRILRERGIVEVPRLSAEERIRATRERTARYHAGRAAA